MVNKWINSVKIEAYGAEETEPMPKAGINETDRHFARLVSDPKTHKQTIEFMLREQDLEISYFKPFAPGHKHIYYNEDFGVEIVHKPTCLKVKHSMSQDRESNLESARKVLASRLSDLLNKSSKTYTDPAKLKKKKVKHHEQRHEAKLEAEKLRRELI